MRRVTRSDHQPHHHPIRRDQIRDTGDSDQVRAENPGETGRAGGRCVPRCASPRRAAREPSTQSDRAIPRAIPTRTSHRTGSLAILVVALLVALLVCSPDAARAETAVLAIAGSVDEVLTNIRNWLMGILAGLATVFLTLGGVRRIFGAGDPGEQEKAKDSFRAAGIGYALAALAPLVVTILKGIVGA